ncbi:hypothetical protein GCM10009730_32470 [Streptomyces albidochromogenes]|uniref:amphi-Trp domain-containing protein n=1 Tax=Streptomyces albidochromogenes TaxID=329524 RepID=UPI00110FE991|nr:amphi-Trp domain-containing protein [Streptomyces albidochromogenes]
MTDLKFEQKRSLSRLEAADQLSRIAAALKEGGDAELELGAGTVSLRVPEELHSEIEVEVGNGEIELEIEFTWPLAPERTAPSADGAQEATKRKSVPAKPRRTSTGGNRGKSAKRSATKDT